MAVEVIGHNAPDGMTLGASATELVSVYGVTPIAQRAGATQVAVPTTTITAPGTTAATSTNPYGYATTTQADAVTTALAALVTRVAAIEVLVNELRAAAVAFGTIKGAA